MIFEKRGRWCFYENGRIKKFATEAAAKAAIAKNAPAMGILELDDNGYFIKECEDCECDPCECEEEFEVEEVSEESVEEAPKKANYNTYRM